MTDDVRSGLGWTAWGLTIAAGAAIGMVYALSPLTVWCAVAIAFVVRAAVTHIDGDERRWVMTLLIAAVAARVIAVAVLFAATDHARVPFGSFFGDEEYFIKRSLWLRNVALGIPIHGADLIYAFDEYSATSYLYVLAFIQVLVGPAPYGAHLLGITFYLGGSVVLFRTVRSTLGRMPALVGLSLLLFLPSLFAWSISALKDPLFFLLTASSVALTLRVVRGPGWTTRLVALAAIVAAGIALESIRVGGAALSTVSIVGGLAVAALVRRPRLLLATVVAVPMAAGLVLQRPAAQVKAYRTVLSGAQQHWGHAATLGVVYKVLDPRFYHLDLTGLPDRAEIPDMHAAEMLRFMVRAAVRYIVVPLPWEVQSKAALAFLPEQTIWLMLVACAPFGLVFGFRRDAVVTGLLLGHALVAAMTVALVSGNVGTLVRHRGLALPYLVWLSAVGACELLTRLETPPALERIESA